VNSLTTNDFIQRANKIHNNKYDYSLVNYKNNKQKVKIICSKHGIFEQIPGNHLRNQGCPQCSIEKSKQKRSLTTNDFIQKANKIHNNKYDYSLVDYKHSHQKIKIICSKHGVFEQVASSHLNGCGCNNCFINNQSGDFNHFYNLSVKIHNNKYDYSLVDYKNMKTKVKIICPKHGVFEQCPDNHIHNQGCPQCISKNYVSKSELDIRNWIKSYVTIDTNNKKLISPYEVDILIPKYKIAIEYNGLYWHSEQQGKDKYYHLKKFNLCMKKNYRLIQIWENEWILKKDIVKSILLSSINGIKNKINGRQCKINNVTPKIAKCFYENNHIQGFKGGQHKGLFYNNQLVSLMTIDKKGELQRFANKIYTIVHGSFSKLLKSFDKKSIFTFADLRYFTGNVYIKNNFKYVYTTRPNYYYFKKLCIYHRMNFQKKKIEQKNMKFDSNLTEYQNMLQNGYDRIWDCGNKKFLLDNL